MKNNSIHYFFNINKTMSSNYDLYKYISEFSSSTVSMSLIDYVLYNKSMN